MTDYLVTALCTIYKAERFMRGLLEDLEAQTLADRMEIVITDSASPQNERTIVEDFQKRYDNIVYVRTPVRENSHIGFNRCIELARGKYLTMACADDRHRPDAFERMAAVLDSRPDIALVYANSHITRTENERFDRHTRTGEYRWIDFDPVALLHGCYMGPQPMWRRDLHTTYGLLDGGLLSAGDWDFWLRLAERERFLHIDEFLGLYLYSESSSEHHNPAQTRKEADLVCRRYAHRELALREKQRRRSLRLPAQGGVQVLVIKQQEGEQLERCVRAARAQEQDVKDASVEVVRAHAAVPENRLGVIVSPPTPTAIQTLAEAVAVGAEFVAVIAQGVMVKEGWLKESLDALRSDDAGAALSAGPAGPCALVLKCKAARDAGGLQTELPFSLAIEDLLGRMQAAGLRTVHTGGERISIESPFAAPDLETLVAAGQAAVERGDMGAAVNVFRVLTRAFPDLAAGHAALGSVLLAMGRFGEAASSLQCAARLAPNDKNTRRQLDSAMQQVIMAGIATTEPTATTAMARQ